MQTHDLGDIDFQGVGAEDCDNFMIPSLKLT